MKNEAKVDSSFALAYVGTVVPDCAEFGGQAFSRAGAYYQGNLLAAMQAAGSPPDAILSVRPIPAFPRASALWVPGGSTALDNGMTVTLLPFLNITPVKQVWVGLAAMLALAGWAWERRSVRRVVLCYNLTVPPAIFILAGAWLTRSKAVAFVADVNVPGQTVPNGLLYRLDFWLHRMLMPRFDGLVVVSDAISSELAPRVPALRMEGGVPPRVLDRTLRTRTNESTFVIASAGSLDEANGTHLLLDAFKRLEGAHFRLIIAGSGPLEGLVRQAAAVDERIRFEGFVPFGRVLAIYEEADVLVSMRLTKAINTKYFYPSKLMECLASGLPVVTTRVGRVEEEMGDYVWLVGEETASGLLDAILRAASEPRVARLERAAKARAFMAEHKTWAAQAARVRTFVEQLVEER